MTSNIYDTVKQHHLLYVQNPPPPFFKHFLTTFSSFYTFLNQLITFTSLEKQKTTSFVYLFFKKCPLRVECSLQLLAPFICTFKKSLLNYHSSVFFTITFREQHFHSFFFLRKQLNTFSKSLSSFVFRLFILLLILSTTFIIHSLTTLVLQNNGWQEEDSVLLFHLRWLENIGFEDQLLLAVFPYNSLLLLKHCIFVSFFEISFSKTRPQLLVIIYLYNVKGNVYVNS